MGPSPSTGSSTLLLSYRLKQESRFSLDTETGCIYDIHKTKPKAWPLASRPQEMTRHKWKSVSRNVIQPGQTDRSCAGLTGKLRCRPCRQPALRAGTGRTAGNGPFPERSAECFAPQTAKPIPCGSKLTQAPISPFPASVPNRLVPDLLFGRVVGTWHAEPTAAGGVHHHDGSAIPCRSRGVTDKERISCAQRRLCRRLDV